MKSSILVVSIAVIFCANADSAAIWFEDGQTHDLYNATNDSVYVRDYQGDYPTTVNLWDGSRVWTLEALQQSKVNLIGGIVPGGVYAYDNSIVSVVSGVVNGSGAGEFRLHQNSKLYMSGGEIVGYCSLESSSQAYFSGGSADKFRLVGGWLFYEGGNINLVDIGAYSVFTISGSGFLINGKGIGYGIYSWQELYDPMQPPSGALSLNLCGILENGDVINNMRVDLGNEGYLVLVPEPTSLLLLGLGGMLIRRK
jgi:hypothetical protein